MNNTGYTLGGIDLLIQHAETQKSNTFWTLVYIKKGIGMYLLDEDLRPVNQGDIIILPPRLSYSFCTADLGDEYNVNLDAVVLRFNDHWLTNLLTVFGSMNRVVLSIREMRNPYAVVGPKWMKVSGLLDELMKAGASRKAVIVLEILEMISSGKDMVRILLASPCDAISLDERKKKIDRYISTHLLDKISLESVADYIGMNRTYFCLFFKKHYGKGFADYLNDLRIEKAASLLLQGDMQMSEIASECGFKTVPYFNRAFKRSKGLTPGSYRRKHKSL